MRLPVCSMGLSKKPAGAVRPGSYALVGGVCRAEGVNGMAMGAAMRLDLRRFLGYGLSERLPVHQTLSHAHTRRFVDGVLFERLFRRSLELCMQHGLVEGTHLSIDGLPCRGGCGAREPTREPRLGGVAGGRGWRRERRERGQRAGTGRPACARRAARRRAADLGASRVRAGRTALWPDAEAPKLERDLSLAYRPGGEAARQARPAPHLVYRGQVAVDRKHRVIVACRGEQADGFEGDAVDRLLDRARFACPELESSGADSGFAAERIWRSAERRGISAFIPPQPTMLPKPGEQPQTEAQRQALAARARCRSDAGIESHRQRMPDAEGVIGELKNQGTGSRWWDLGFGLSRRRSRGSSPVAPVQKPCK